MELIAITSSFRREDFLRSFETRKLLNQDNVVLGSKDTLYVIGVKEIITDDDSKFESLVIVKAPLILFEKEAIVTFSAKENIFQMTIKNSRG